MIWMVVYYMPAHDSVYTMTVCAVSREAAEQEVRKRLKSKAGRGVWAYEMFPYDAVHRGRIDNTQS